MSFYCRYLFHHHQVVQIKSIWFEIGWDSLWPTPKDHHRVIKAISDAGVCVCLLDDLNAPARTIVSSFEEESHDVPNVFIRNWVLIVLWGSTFQVGLYMSVPERGQFLCLCRCTQTQASNWSLRGELSVWTTLSAAWSSYQSVVFCCPSSSHADWVVVVVVNK